MTLEFHEKIALYIKHIRPLIAQENQEQLFITGDGIGFPDGTIGKQIAQWWTKAKGKQITSTQLRKMTASTFHEAKPVNKRKVGRQILYDWLMSKTGLGEPCHSQKKPWSGRPQ